MADYPQSPFNPGGGGVFWQRTDPSTWMLYNNPPPQPTTTTTLPPQADAGSVYAAPLSDEMYQAYQQQQAAQGATTGLAAMGVLSPAEQMALNHGSYQNLRSLDQLMRTLPPGMGADSLYPFIQSLMDRGVLYSGAGGVGLDMSLPYGGPNAPKTQRLIDLFEQYQDYLKGGGQPVYFPTASPNPAGPPQYDPNQPRILGTLP